MAWFCKECDDFFVFGYSEKYCSEECYDDKQERKAKKKAKKNHKKNELEKIKKDIIEFKDDKKQQIKNKYKINIDYISNKVKIISRNERFKNKIISLELEENEIKKALKELEYFKYN